MKATIYTRDGKVSREVVCSGVETYMNDLVVLEGADLYTNQPVVVDGEHPEWNAYLEGSQKFDLTLTIGKMSLNWEGARALIVQENMLSFWYKGEWHTVVGDVIIENMRAGGPVEVEA